MVRAARDKGPLYGAMMGFLIQTGQTMSVLRRITWRNIEEKESHGTYGIARVPYEMKRRDGGDDETYRVVVGRNAMTLMAEVPGMKERSENKELVFDISDRHLSRLIADEIAEAAGPRVQEHFNKKKGKKHHRITSRSFPEYWEKMARKRVDRVVCQYMMGVKKTTYPDYLDSYLLGEYKKFERFLRVL
jgi:hypothetical protein